jgi:hypothetical protein
MNLVRYATSYPPLAEKLVLGNWYGKACAKQIVCFPWDVAAHLMAAYLASHLSERPRTTEDQPISDIWNI